MLEASVLEAVDPAGRDVVRGRVRFIDTVIGKMSGVVTDELERQSLGLVPIAPGLSDAFLVEEFNDILVSRIDPIGSREAIHPGTPVLREVDDLAPFEAAKLLGHNATHALAGFLGSQLGLRRVAELADVPGAMDFLRQAFIEESGQILIGRYAGSDRLFTPAGYAAFADDLLARMVNPFLADTIERAARDPVRKLGWDDRLVGLIRMGLAQGVSTRRYAIGVAAGLHLIASGAAVSVQPDERLLRSCWPAGVDPGEAAAVLEVVETGRTSFDRWATPGGAPATGWSMPPIGAR
jgi:mannitol-1-phosphate 5-dehydrogenase